MCYLYVNYNFFTGFRPRIGSNHWLYSIGINGDAIAYWNLGPEYDCDEPEYDCDEYDED